IVDQDPAEVGDHAKAILQRAVSEGSLPSDEHRGAGAVRLALQRPPVVLHGPLFVRPDSRLQRGTPLPGKPGNSRRSDDTVPARVAAIVRDQLAAEELLDNADAASQKPLHRPTSEPSTRHGRPWL